MNYKIVTTKDQSHTILDVATNETFHSVFGAIQESKHIFIRHGFREVPKKSLRILEVGFGTGLNCFLSLLEAEKQQKKVQYYGIEPNILDFHLVKSLNYPSLLAPQRQKLFVTLHASSTWNRLQVINSNFSLFKINSRLEDTNLKTNYYDLVYFDVFSPKVQPALWEEKIVKKIYDSMTAHAIIVTYSSKGLVKRNLKKSGFQLTRLDGPLGKRHFLRGQKISD